VGKCKASAGYPNVQRRRKCSGNFTIARSITSGYSSNGVGQSPWWALLHKIGVIVLILALLFVSSAKWHLLELLALLVVLG
jgi:hypothetical protein